MFDELIESVDRPRGRRVAFVDRAEDGREQKLGFAPRHVRAAPQDLGAARAPFVPLGHPHAYAAMLAAAKACPFEIVFDAFNTRFPAPLVLNSGMSTILPLALCAFHPPE